MNVHNINNHLASVCLHRKASQASNLQKHWLKKSPFTLPWPRVKSMQPVLIGNLKSGLQIVQCSCLSLPSGPINELEIKWLTSLNHWYEYIFAFGTCGSFS